MPDFERVTRSLELHLPQLTRAKAFVRGKHVGQDDLARKQAVGLFTAVTLTAILINALTGAWKGLLG